MRMKMPYVLLFYNQSMAIDDDKLAYIPFRKNLLGDKEK